MLLDAGADVNAQGGRYSNALQAASCRGSPEIVKMLLDAGADIHAQGGHFGNALQAASWQGLPETVKMLLDAGADVHAQGGEYGNALQAATIGGHQHTAAILQHGAIAVNCDSDYVDASSVDLVKGYRESSKGPHKDEVAARAVAPWVAQRTVSLWPEALAAVTVLTTVWFLYGQFKIFSRPGIRNITNIGVGVQRVLQNIFRSKS